MLEAGHAGGIDAGAFYCDAASAFGNAATRLETFAVKGGAYSYGGYPDIDELYPQQAAELDHKKREAMLHKMQQLVYEKVIAAPIWQLAGLAGVGPRVGEATIGSMDGYPWLSPAWMLRGFAPPPLRDTHRGAIDHLDAGQSAFRVTSSRHLLGGNLK